MEGLDNGSAFPKEEDRIFPKREEGQAFPKEEGTFPEKEGNFPKWEKAFPKPIEKDNNNIDNIEEDRSTSNTKSKREMLNEYRKLLQI